jgi:hypothetical protein
MNYILTVLLIFHSYWFEDSILKTINTANNSVEFFYLNGQLYYSVHSKVEVSQWNRFLEKIINNFHIHSVSG